MIQFKQEAVNYLNSSTNFCSFVTFYFLKWTAEIWQKTLFIKFDDRKKNQWEINFKQDILQIRWQTKLSK